MTTPTPTTHHPHSAPSSRRSAAPCRSRSSTVRPSWPAPPGPSVTPGVTAVDLGTQWAGLVDSGEPFVLHDALCPMTPAAFIAECLARSVATGAVVVAVDGAGTVLSPVVLPGAVVAELDELPSLDFAELVSGLEPRFVVERVPAPASAARVDSLEDVAALEALTTPDTT